MGSPSTETNICFS